MPEAEERVRVLEARSLAQAGSLLWSPWRLPSFAESFLPGSHIVVLGLLSLHVLREATSTFGPDVIVEPGVPTAPKAEDLADKRFLTGRRTQWNFKH
jgi:hypothetical protein